MYAKINAGVLQIPELYPCYIIDRQGRRINNPTNAQYEANGYKPLVVAEHEEREGYEAEPVYTDEGNQIVQSWTYVEVTANEVAE